MAVKLLAELAPAKINLFLRVVGRRADGYHQLDSIFIPISLYDQVRLELRPSEKLTIVLRCDHGGLPADDRNLASRAAAAFAAEFGITAEILIELHKRIPIGAGLGGGSSDAGTMLSMMAALYRIDNRERLARVGVGLGADVPFFLDPRPAHVAGIGEQITPLKSIPPLHLVIAVPAVEVSTAEIFRALRPEDWSGPASDGDVAAMVAGKIQPAMLVNDLERAAIERCPRIRELKAILQDLGASAAAMTGSGSAVFGIFAEAGQARSAASEAIRRAPDSRFFAVASLGEP